jgi:hypothetical protein
MAAAVALLVSAPMAVGAEQVYKSIDAAGNVTYSATPPAAPDVADVETLSVEPGPTPTEQREAEQRAREVEAAVRQQAAARRAKSARDALAVDSARDRLKQAEQALAEARQRDAVGDWQTLSTGGRVPSEAYLERVAEAERRVREAEEALKAAQQTAN